MKAIVMAGGQGSRLRPLTIARPKPLIPLVNRPVIAHIIAWLKRHGIEDVVITLQYQAEWFQRYFDREENLGVRIQYLVEDVPLGTAGSVANVIRSGKVGRDETLLVVSGDAVTDIDLGAMRAFHEAQGADVTLALYSVSNPLEYGMVITEPDGRITRFVEKPGWAEVVSDLVNTGIYMLDASLLEKAPTGRMYDFSHDLFPALMAEGRRLYGYTAEGYWCDVGAPAAYLQANLDMLFNRVRHEPFGRSLGGDIWVGENVSIAEDARLSGPLYLGNNVQIKGGAVIQGPAVVRDDTVVDSRASISRSVIWRGCYIGEDVQIHGAVISRQSIVKARAQIQEGVVIGDQCLISENAVIYTNVKLWPSKVVEPGAHVRHSIIWGSHGRRVLFGRFGVTGVINVDLTPEFAAKLGVAFGATLPKGSQVTINRDVHPGSRMLKRAIISGLPAAGVQVLDLRSQPLPVARFFTRNSSAVAGVHVSISPFDRRVIDIRFLNDQGLNLGRDKEREVERVFFREDFRRAQVDDIGVIRYANDVRERYTAAFLQHLQGDAIENAGFIIAIDYAHAGTIDLLEPLLARLQVEVVSLNTRPEPNSLSVTPEEWQQGMNLLARMVAAMNLDLGVRLDVSGEKVFFVDERGQVVNDVTAAAVMAALIWTEHPEAVVATPIDRPSLFERLAARYRGRVIRTRFDIQDLMETAEREQVHLAVDGNGHFICPHFQPVPDGMFAVARLLALLARQQTTMREVIAGLPAYSWRHRAIPCSWEEKGRAMRLVKERAQGLRSVAIDGLKYYLDEETWVLVRSDPDRPLLHINVESPADARTEQVLEQEAAWLQGQMQG
ncbi:MAG: nucleotidyl transferase [Chloroflexi bacterium]|nr:MAG: nucleotidyl transferase [Chloroflexota bacterium]